MVDKSTTGQLEKHLDWENMTEEELTEELDARYKQKGGVHWRRRKERKRGLEFYNIGLIMLPAL